MPQKQRDAQFAPLHDEWAPKALNKILELRGFYIKTGQMAASNVGNAFPDKWVRTMEVSQAPCLSLLHTTLLFALFREIMILSRESWRCRCLLSSIIDHELQHEIIPFHFVGLPRYFYQTHHPQPPLLFAPHTPTGPSRPRAAQRHCHGPCHRGGGIRQR
jgi:hypothetical protein